MDVNVKALVQNLLDILEHQEVSLFSISVDDVSPNVRSHLQATKVSNMRAKDVVTDLLSNLNTPCNSLNEIRSAIVSMPYPSSSYPSASYPSSSAPTPIRYSLDPSISMPNLYSYSSPSSSAPTISPTTIASAYLSSSNLSTPPSSPVRIASVPTLSLSSSAIQYSPSPPSPTSLSASSPPSPTYASAPSSPIFADSSSLESSTSSPRAKGRLNFFRKYTESKLNKSTTEFQSPKTTKRRGFTLLFQNDNKLVSSPSSPLSPRRPPSPPSVGMRKTMSLPTASAAAGPDHSPSKTQAEVAPESPQFLTASPSKKGERQHYQFMHEQSKLLFAKKLETLRASQGDAY